MATGDEIPAHETEDNIHAGVNLDTCHKKLRYYLECAYEVIDHDIDKSSIIGVPLKDVVSCNDTSELLESKMLLRACALLQPSSLLDRCFFVAPTLCGGYGNKFIAVKEARKTINEFPDDSALKVAVGTESYKVSTTIMVFKLAWLVRNFVDPFNALVQYLQERVKKESSEKSKGITREATKSDVEIHVEIKKEGAGNTKSSFCQIL